MLHSNKKRKVFYDEKKIKFETEEENPIQELIEKLVPVKKRKVNHFNFNKDEETIYLRDNHLYYMDHVELSTVDKVKQLMRDYYNEVKEIKNMNSSLNFTPKPLYLHINTGGGELTSGLSLYDFITEYSTHIPVHTVIEGYAASAGTIISIAGTIRYITPSSYLLIHQLSTMVSGTYSNIKDETENCDKLMKRITEIYLEKSKFNRKSLEKILKRDIYLDAKEAIKYGLVDEIKTIDTFND